MFALRKTIQGILFSTVILLGYSVEGQAQVPAACTPVVYVFRHAEDHNGINDGPPYGLLTWIGQRHAQLYPDMVADFAATSGHCPLTRVYASNPSKPEPANENLDGSTNAFCTARPLAQLGTIDSQKQAHDLILTVSPKLFCSTEKFPPINRPDNKEALTRTSTDPIIYLCGTPHKPSQE